MTNPKVEKLVKPKVVKPKMISYARQAYSAEDCVKVIENVILKHPQLSFREAIEADHALNSISVHLGVGVKEVEKEEKKEEKKENDQKKKTK